MGKDGIRRMFLKHALFKKLLKATASGEGVLIAADQEGYYLEGGRWRAYMEKDRMDKETKSVIIGIAGEFPDRMPFVANGKYNQYEIQETIDIPLYLEQAETAKRKLKDTGVELKNYEYGCHLFQVEKEKKIVMVESRITEMISKRTAEKTEDDFPTNPYLIGDHEVGWFTDSMIFSCGTVELREGRPTKFVRILENYEF